MKKILKWILISLASVLLLILVTLAGAHLYLATDTGGRRLLSFINTLYPGKITGSSVEVSLLSQQASLTDFVLKGPDGEIIVRAKQASLEIDLPALLKYELILKNIYATRAECTLSLDEENYLNIEKAFVEPGPEASPWNVYLRNLTLEDGSLSFFLADGEELVRGKEVKFRMDAAFTNDTVLKMAVPSSQVALNIAGKTVDLGSSSLSATIFNDNVRDIRVAGSRASSRLFLTGSVTGISGKAQLHLAGRLDAELADFAEGLGITGETKGRLSGTIDMKGDYDNPGASCNLAYGGGTLAGYPVGRATLAGTVNDRVFTCSGLRTDFASGTLDITGDVNLKKVFPKGYFEGEMHGDAAAYALSVRGKGLNIPEMPGMPRDMKGRLDARTNVEGTGLKEDTLSLRGSFSAGIHGLTIPGSTALPELALEGTASYSGGSILFDPVKARTTGAMLSYTGSVQTGSGSINGSLVLDAPEIKTLLQSFGIPARGSLTGRADLSGTLERPAADISLAGEGCGYQDVVLGSIAMKGTLDGTGSLTVRECTVTNQASAVTVSGVLGLFRDFPSPDPDLPMNIKASFSRLSPHNFIPDLSLTGAFTGSVSVEGNVSSLSGTMDLEGEKVTYEGIALGSVQGKAVLGNGMLTVPSLAVQNGSSSFRASGSSRVLQNHSAPVKDPEIQVTIQEGKLFLEDFAAHARGLVELSGSLQGTLGHPTGILALSGNNLFLGPQKFSRLDITARPDGERVLLEPVSLEVTPGQKVNGTGWMAVNGDYSFSLSSTGLTLESLHLYQGIEGVRGNVFLELSGDGNLKHPKMAGRISVRDIFFKDRPFRDSTLSFHLIDSRITYEGSLNFNLQGSYDLDTDQYQSYAKFDETDMDPYFILMGKPLLSGTLTGTLSAAGILGKPDGSVVEADFSKVDISFRGKNLLMADKVTGSYLNGILSIPRTHIMLGERGSLDLTGSGDPKKNLVLNAEGIVPMEVIGSFFEEFADSAGFIGFSAHMRPINSRPELVALVSLDDVAYTVSYNGQRVTGINGKIRIENNRITIEEMKGKLDAGSFEMGGAALVKDFTIPTEMELYARAKDLPFSIPDTMDVTLDAEASFDLKDGNSVLRAEVMLLEGTYYKDVNVNLLTGVMEQLIPLQRRQQQQQAGVSLPPFLQKTVLDVSIERRGEVQVDNNIAQLNINPDLEVGGTLNQPIVNGRVAVTDGIVTFQNNEFTVTRGIIDFLNPYRTEPTVDIRGETKVRTWTIDLTISGKLDNLEFELSSTPSEEPSDILSLLIVGKTTREMTQDQTGVTVSPSSMLAELVTGTYGEKVKKVTSLDVLKFESSQFATTGGESLKLTLGKELSPRLSVTYSMETRDTETVQMGVAEYKLLENLLIRGSQGSNGIFGVDMQYRREFR
jgi:autotransporter translocation and assembly factor TamB